MRGLLALAATVATIAVAAGGLWPGAASAGHASKNCGIVTKGTHDYRIRSAYLKCKIARRSSLKYLRTQEARGGFDCAPTEGGNFYCQNGESPPKAYWAIRL